MSNAKYMTTAEIQDAIGYKSRIAYKTLMERVPGLPTPIIQGRGKHLLYDRKKAQQAIDDYLKTQPSLKTSKPRRTRRYIFDIEQKKQDEFIALGKAFLFNQKSSQIIK